MAAALTDPAGRKKSPSKGCLIPFFLLFLAAGLAVVWFITVRPLLKTFAADKWPETPCSILSSEVGQHSGSKGGTTYSIDIHYRYEFQGEAHESKAYDFLESSSSGFEGKAAVVARYPAASIQVCYVNPRDPAEAVLARGFHPGYLFGLLGLIFVAVGGGGIYFVLRPVKPRRTSTSGAAAPLAVPMGSTTLRPSTTPGCRLSIAVAIALFWNGIVSIFVFGGGLDGCAMLVMIPFILVGLGLIAWVGYQFLALFNPRPVLVVSAGVVPLGGSFDLHWRLKGRVQKLKTLRITLEGREEATYRRGTKTSTDKIVFITLVLHGDAVVREGRVNVQIPRGTMHTFKAANNKILWSLHVRGEIPRWPDVNEEFPFEVLPA